ncbi:hypothetical protein LJR230_004236 [Trinickia sp. LjRoot230]
MPPIRKLVDLTKAPPAEVNTETSDSSHAAHPTKQGTVAGVLAGLNHQRPTAKTNAGAVPAATREIGNASVLSAPNDAQDSLVSNPFIVDRKHRTITNDGKACLIRVGDKSRQLSAREFLAADLLIDNIGQYVSMDTLCEQLDLGAESVKIMLFKVRHALGLGSTHNLYSSSSSLVLIPDGSPARGYGIFRSRRAIDELDAGAGARGTQEALFVDLEPQAQLLDCPPDAPYLAVRIANYELWLYVTEITGRIKPEIRWKALPGEASSQPVDATVELMVGWDQGRGVYALKKKGRSTFVSNALLNGAEADDIFYIVEALNDLPEGVFKVESAWAAKPRAMMTAIQGYLAHEQVQASGIPFNVTQNSEVQAIVLAQLGAQRHGLLGVSPLPVYDLSSPYPSNALLYINPVFRVKGGPQFGIRPTLPGQNGGKTATFYQADGVSTFVLGVCEYDGETLVIAWDPASYPEMRERTLMSVEEDTLREAQQSHRLVSQWRRQLRNGRSEEVLVAPLDLLAELITMRSRPDPRRRLIDALGGESIVRRRFNEHVWTMMVDERLLHIQWCGALLRGNIEPHITPFSSAERFVPPAPDTVAILAAYDASNDVVVFWRQDQIDAAGPNLLLIAPESVLEDAAHNGTALHTTETGRRSIQFRDVVASPYESRHVSSALRQLLSVQDRSQVWRTRRSDVHDELEAYLRPVESGSTRIRPWPVTVDLPNLGETSLDLFAYRAQPVSKDRPHLLVIQPHIVGSEKRNSFFSGERRPVVLGEWKGIYFLVDPKAHPTMKLNQRITVSIRPELLEKVRSEGIWQITRPIGAGEFEERVIFSTAPRLLDAIAMRLVTPPILNAGAIQQAVNAADPDALEAMATRMRYALDLPDRDALTGTRNIPDRPLVIAGPPHGIALFDFDVEERLAIAPETETDQQHLLRIHSDGAGRAVVLNAHLCAVLQEGEAPRWPSRRQFDVLWALAYAAAYHQPVSAEVIEAACMGSLEWLFLGSASPFALSVNAINGAYGVRYRRAGGSSEDEERIPSRALDLLLNHGALYAEPKANPILAWKFMKRVGLTKFLPAGPYSDVLFQLGGRRVRVSGLCRVLWRTKDGQTAYVVPRLSEKQLNRIRSHPEELHVLAGFDPSDGAESWVFWRADAHIDRLSDPGYRICVSAQSLGASSHEWRPMEDGRDELIAISHAKGPLSALRRLLNDDVLGQTVAVLESEVSGEGITIQQALGVMLPAQQIALSMRLGLAPYTRSHGIEEIKQVVGVVPGADAIRKAIPAAREALAAGEPIPSLSDVLRLLDDEHAEHYMGSRTLFKMLRELYGLGASGKPMAISKAFAGWEIEPRHWRICYRELVMRLVWGAARGGALATQFVSIDSPAAEPTASPDSTLPPVNAPLIKPDVEIDLERMNIDLPDRSELEANQASALSYCREKHGLHWPNGVALPTALARLPPDAELVVRAYLGLWPYGHRYTLAELTAQFEIRTVSLTNTLVTNALDELLAHAESLHGRILPVAQPRPTLERLVELLLMKGSALNSQELNAVLIRHGLAGMRAIVSEPTRRGTLRRYRDSSAYRSAMEKLTGRSEPIQERKEKEAFWSTDQIDEIYKRIDAGEYAKTILRLRDSETRDDTFADMVIRFAVIANRRKIHRLSAVQGRRLNTMNKISDETSMDYETAVTKLYGIDPQFETFMQRTHVLDVVRERSLVVTDAEADELALIVEDGSRAFSEFQVGNIRLTYYIAKRMGYSEDNYEAEEIIDYAMEGMRRAILGNNPKMLFAFSTYANAVVRSVVLRQSSLRHAQRLSVSIGRAHEIIMTRAMRRQLREALQQAFPQAPREPTSEELAKAVLESSLRARVRRVEQSEPTARQMQTAWKQFMPEYVLRIEENIELLEQYDGIRHQRSLDRSFSDANAKNLYDVTASSQDQIEFEAAENDGSAYAVMAGDLIVAFNEAGLTEREQYALQHSFGIIGYERRSAEEIAEHYRIDEEAVAKVIESAMMKVRRSPDAQGVLMRYLRPDRSGDSQ